MNPDEEIVTIVDEANRRTGAAPRQEMRQRRLIHRASYVFVFNSRGELFVHRRAPDKDVYPGYWDPAAGGVVLDGEEYEEAARRELSEELGITGVPLTFAFEFYHEDGGNRVWGRAYRCMYDGPLTLQEEEIDGGAFLPLPRVRDLVSRSPFTPDGLRALDRLLASPAACEGAGARDSG